VPKVHIINQNQQYKWTTDSQSTTAEILENQIWGIKGLSPLRILANFVQLDLTVSICNGVCLVFLASTPTNGQTTEVLNNMCQDPLQNLSLNPEF